MNSCVSKAFLEQISSKSVTTTFSRIIHAILDSSAIYVAVESKSELCVLFTPDNGNHYGLLISFSIMDGQLQASVSPKSIYETMCAGGCFPFDADDFIQEASNIAALVTENDPIMIPEDKLIWSEDTLIESTAKFANVILSYR